MSSDEMQQSRSGSPSKGGRARAWLRRIGGSARNALGNDRQAALAGPSQLDVHTTLSTFPALLDSVSLPNGVVELVIEDFEAPSRQLFDIHDGQVTLVEAGKAVPWASIAGSATDWAMALGPERNITALELTGDEQLARRVLAAIPSAKPIAKGAHSP